MNNLVKTYIKKADTYTQDVKGNVMVNVPGAVLKNMTITGDLIIGDGVGNGEVTLNNVVVTGTTIVRGGGVNSIRIIGNSNVKNIVVTRVNGEVRVFAEDGTEVGTVIVDGKDDVIIEGKVKDVKVEASDITVTANNATIDSLTMNGAQSQIIANKNVTIKNVIVNAKDNKIVAEKGATIKKVEANQDGAKISGSGTVTAVNANANNIVVKTSGTSVAAAKGTTGVVAGDKTVKAGETSKASETTPTSGGSSGGSSSAKTAISAITVTGTAAVGQTLTATASEQPNITATYQWMRGDSGTGTFTNIDGATSKTYTLVSADKDKYIKVVVTGTGSYTGTQTSTATAKVDAAVIEWATDAITTNPKDNDNPPYQLMQINYKRNAVVTSSMITITMKTSASGDVANNTVIWKDNGGTSQNANAYWQWSYRDASSVFVDGSLATTTQENLATVERANVKQLKAGSVVTIKIDAVKDGKANTISRDYTITADDVMNSTYYTAEQAATALTTIQGYATNNDASALTADLLAQAGVTGFLNANLDAYKTIIAGEASIADLTALQSLISAANTTAANQADVDAAIAKVTSPIASITVAGGAGAEANAKTAAVKAYVEGLDGVAALGVTVNVEAGTNSGYKVTITKGAATAGVKDDVAVTEFVAPDTVITKLGDLTNGTASFTWSSVNGIGSQNGKISGSYTYYSDGAYLRFQVKDTSNQVVKFADVFQTGEAKNDTVGGMTLQTNGGTINDMDGSYRERADWGIEGLNAYATSLPNTGNYVFYGLIQNATDGTKTVGFSAGDSRTVYMTLTPKTDLATGTYTVIVETLQQGSDDVKGTITYTFTV